MKKGGMAVNALVYEVDARIFSIREQPVGSDLVSSRENLWPQPVLENKSPSHLFIIKSSLR